ncbi:hypothetical protein N7513_002331 [Penicillium frequentans]|nr:hypothetical protein N7513_002331 [Penicillium glabrum]
MPPQVTQAYHDKAQILAASPYKDHGWNVVRRLKCLSVIEEELESQNDPQLSNVKPIISAYKRDGDDRLRWAPGPVSYWVQGRPVGDVPRYFDWDECLELQQQAVGYGGLWIEGFSLAFKPPSIPKDQFYGLDFGTEFRADDIKALLSSPIGVPMPRFLLSENDTTLLVSPGVMKEIEKLSKADFSCGYSVFHCGEGVLKAYRAVVLEVCLAKPDVVSKDWAWNTTRCAVCPDLSGNEVRISYIMNNQSARDELIAWELEDDTGEQAVLDRLQM